MESMPSSTGLSANSGKSDSACPQLPECFVLRRVPSNAANHPHNSRITLVEVEGDDGEVAINSERALRQVVRVDPKPIKYLAELISEQHIVLNLAHHVDVRAVCGALQRELDHRNAPATRRR